MADGYMAERRTRAVSRQVFAPAVVVPYESTLHPAWQSFLHFCTELQHGEIERLKIQDGLPVLAEVVTKKIKF